MLLSGITAKETSYLKCMFYRQSYIGFPSETIGSKIFTHNTNLTSLYYIQSLLSFLQICKFRCLICCDQAVNDLIQIAV